MADEKTEALKIKFETVADMGSGLIIAKVPVSCLREQDINARVMKSEMQRQLTDNIRKRGQLESLPFCALTKDGTRVEIISGHHRIRSGKDAGLKEIFVILDISGLNRSKITAKQIAHNAISGFDDQDTLRELVKMLDDVDDMIESYAGKELLSEPNEEIEKLLSPKVQFDWKNVSFMFLPHQISDLNALIEATKHLTPDYIGIAELKDYNHFIEVLAKYQDFADVKNLGASIHAMTQAALYAMNEAGFSESNNWVQLSRIFGSAAIPKETADVITQAVKKMIDDGLIDSKSKLDFLKVSAEKYLAGDQNGR